MPAQLGGSCCAGIIIVPKPMYDIFPLLLLPHTSRPGASMRVAFPLIYCSQHHVICIRCMLMLIRTTRLMIPSPSSLMSFHLLSACTLHRELSLTRNQSTNITLLFAPIGNSVGSPSLMRHSLAMIQLHDPGQFGD